ncbi:MAG: histidine kinase [Gaiella sp.]|nr:histidine kinase [Gaiella sp.]
MRVGLFWRVFAVNAGFLALLALLLLVTPVTISAPIALTEAAIVLVALVIALVANALLLRRTFGPLDRLVRRMGTVDLLEPGQRLEVEHDDEVGRVVEAFNGMLERLEAERRERGRRVLAAQEAERVGIARDLHDEVGQALTGVLLQLGSITVSSAEGRQELEEARRSVRSALGEVRRISSELRPEMLADLGLVSALTELTRTFGRAARIRVEPSFDAALPRLSAETELALYRIAQESLTNVARHARASRVQVDLKADESRVLLVVRDDGVGLDGASTEYGGLRGMRERAVLVGGALEIREPAAGGVEVRVEVPADGSGGG